MAQQQDDLTTASAPEEGRWTFDEGVTAAFEDMLARSIPNYEDMRRFVTGAAAHFAPRTGQRQPLIVDLGASRGAALQPIVDKLGARARFAACDISEPMLEACGERFEGYIDAGIFQLLHHDLRQGYPRSLGMASVVLSVLTMQFVPIEYRTQLLGDIYDHLAPGGAFLLVEKVMGLSAPVDKVMTKLYYELKEDNGYEPEAIERKRLALEGVLVPLTARFNEELLRNAGFADAEQVWGWGPFRGWLAVKK